VHQKTHWKKHKRQCEPIKQALALPAGEVDARFQITLSDDSTTTWTYLAFAVVCELVPLAQHLLELGADKVLADDQGKTPLFMACAKGMSEVVKLLVERGADVNAKDDRGHTPMSLSVDSNHP